MNEGAKYGVYIEYYLAVNREKFWHNAPGFWNHYAEWNKPDTKDQRCTIPLIGNIYSRQIYREERGIPVSNGWGRRRRGFIASWARSVCLGWWKGFENRQWWRLHNVATLIDDPELNGKFYLLYLCVFCHKDIFFNMISKSRTKGSSPIAGSKAPRTVPGGSLSGYLLFLSPRSASYWSDDL